MSKTILIMDMPTCCDECFALDDNGDYPICRITQEQRGYTFNIRTRKMDKCPLKEMPKKYDMAVPHTRDWNGEYEYGWNACIDYIIGE